MMQLIVKMTGGTPEVRSHKSLTLLIFDIWYLTFDMWTFEYLNIWTFEHLNIWTFDYLKIWTFEHLNIWTFEYLNIWTFDLLNIQHSISILWHQLHWHCFSDLGKYSKNYFFSSCLLIQRGGGWCQREKKIQEFFLKGFFFKNHIESF